jgi:hypothetical protein
MRCRRALLRPADGDGAAIEIDLIAAQVDQLGHAQAVAVGDQDHDGVPMAPPVALGGLDQLRDLSLGQVLAAPQLRIRTAHWGN